MTTLAIHEPTRPWRLVGLEDFRHPHVHEDRALGYQRLAGDFVPNAGDRLMIECRTGVPVLERSIKDGSVTERVEWLQLRAESTGRHWSEGLLVPQSVQEILSTQTMTLPCVPLWSGFAINTIFYAAVLWMLFAVPVKLRKWRRIKRGQCASCGYSLRENTSEKCPECGCSAPSPSGRGRGEGEMKTR
jgi:hypothetical protein